MSTFEQRVAEQAERKRRRERWQDRARMVWWLVMMAGWVFIIWYVADLLHDLRLFLDTVPAVREDQS